MRFYKNTRIGFFFFFLRRLKDLLKYLKVSLSLCDAKKGGKVEEWKRIFLGLSDLVNGDG